MNKYNLNTLNGQINELIDNKNRLYKIPNYCINDPYFVKQIKKIDENHQIQTISISLYDVYDNKKTRKAHHEPTSFTCKQLQCRGNFMFSYMRLALPDNRKATNGVVAPFVANLLSGRVNLI